MKITDIKIRRLISDPDQKTLRAMISITLDEQIAVHDIKVIEANGRLFVAMPSRRDQNGGFRDIVHPIDSKTRCSIEAEILSCYRRAVQSQKLVLHP